VLYVDDPDVNQLTIYQRKDRSQRGKVHRFSAVPNVPLQKRDGTTINLHAYYDSLQNYAYIGEPPRPLFIVAGSVS